MPFKKKMKMMKEGSLVKEAKWFKAMVKTERFLTNSISWVCAAWFAAMILCMVWQVVSRFVLNISVPWTDEASRYLWITLCFIGAGAAISEGAHVEINIVASFIKKIEDKQKKYRMAQISDVIRYIIMIGLGVFLAYQFLTFSGKVIKLGQLSAAMLLPMYVPYLVIDIGIISVIIHSVFRLVISIVDHESIIDPQVVKEGDV